MNVFNKVTLNYLKKNKVRTAVTVIGIMLSAAMICAVTTFVSSIKNYMLEYSVYSDGGWYGAVYGANSETYDVIKKDDGVSDISYSEYIGYAEIEGNNDYKPYLYVIGGDSPFFEMLPVHLTEGNLPTGADEILIPEHLAENGGVVLSVGDILTLDVGDRIINGETVGQDRPCYVCDPVTGDDVPSGEELLVREKKSYKVVGFYERPSFEDFEAPGYTAITFSKAEPDGDSELDIYFSTEKASDVYKFSEKLGIDMKFNADVLLFMGTSRYDNFTQVLYSLAAIVTALIVFGSVALIYNAFSISVSERTRQFGLLSSIGATKKQLRKAVLFEAFAVSSVGIPLGIAVGIAGIGVTLLFIGNGFNKMIAGSFNAPMRICVSWEAVLLAVALSLITVLISALIPAKRATKVSAIEAIRQSTDIKSDKKPLKTPRFIYAVFGLSGALASKYYVRNGKKYRTTVISLFMSIVLFVSASAFTDYLMESVSGAFSSPEYDLYYYTDSEEDASVDKLYEIFTSDDYVTDSVFAYRGYFNGDVSKEILTDSFKEKYSDFAATDGENGKITLSGYLYFVDDTAFDNFLSENGLEREDYYDKSSPLGIAFDNRVEFDGRKEKYVIIDTLKDDGCTVECSAETGAFPDYWVEETETDPSGNKVCVLQSYTYEEETITVPYEEVFATFTLEAKKTLTEEPFYVSPSVPAHLVMIYPESMINEVLPEKVKDTSFSGVFYIATENHTASFANLQTALKENGFDDSLVDESENMETEITIVNVFRVFAYGFTILISLISAANVFNTVSTNIGLRRREFAMLKAVGMTKKDFNGMMNFECFLYGAKALLYGLPVSAIIAYFMNKSISGGYEMAFRLPLGAMLTVTVGVFAIVFSTMIYSMNKIKKGNLIDALKNENL